MLKRTMAEEIPTSAQFTAPCIRVGWLSVYPPIAHYLSCIMPNIMKVGWQDKAIAIVNRLMLLAHPA